MSASALPTWDLTHLYQSIEDPVFDQDLDKAKELSAQFAEAYQGKLASLSADQFLSALTAYEAMQDQLGKIISFAQLNYAGNNSDAKIAQFYQNTQERITEISSGILFFYLEINTLEDEKLAEFYKHEGCLAYRSWVEDIRVHRPYQLSEEMERLLFEKSVAGSSAWSRLFDETMAALRFPFQEEMLTNSEILDKMSSTQAGERQEAAQSFGTVLGENIRLFSLITNTLAKDKAIEDEWRGLKRPISGRNLGNLVEDEVVDALMSSVKAAYPRLSHRYYALKAKWFKTDKLDYWDRNAPLPAAVERTIEWREAQDIVLTSYGAFDPEMADIGKRFFEEKWIDAPPRAGKDSGAFAHPVTPSTHPYILLNYHGKVRDVMTLAHELGHGVHQVLAAPRGALMSDTPLTLAETASVFGEMLTFQSMLSQEQDEVKKAIMIAGKVEDMLNTVVRQTAFCDFETRLHDQRKIGELSAEEIGEIWLDVQRESLGPDFNFGEEYQYYWSYIPHFIHSPFYVYAYAFGDCLVNSLYGVFQEGHEGFQKKYRDLLAAGGTKRHHELLAPFGLDARDSAFWDKGLSMVAGYIDQLEKLDVDFS